MDAAPLMGGALEDSAQGAHQSGVLVGDDEPHRRQASALQGA
jgi:hypothetical protein